MNSARGCDEKRRKGKREIIRIQTTPKYFNEYKLF